MSRLHFWAADKLGQALWRMHLPAEALRRAGHDVTVSMGLGPEHHDADAIVGARVAEDRPTELWQYLANRGARLVYDIDDDYLCLDQSNPAVAYFAHPRIQANIKANISAATVVTCVSQRLADKYAEINPHTIVVPNGLPGHVHQWSRPASGAVALGWSGSGSTLHDLQPVAHRIRRTLTRDPGLILRTVGARGRDLVGVGLRDQVEIVEWATPGDEYLHACQHFDIWLAPYRSTEFNRCKAATKAIEAAALGIPIVASAIEPYERHIEHGVTGFLVRRDHEWDTYIRALVDDPGLRARMGQAARGRSQTVEDIRPLWEQALGIRVEVSA